MTNQLDADLAEAIGALVRTAASLESRVAALEAEQQRLKTERQAYIDLHVQRLLPDLSRNTLKGLQAAAPRFVDAEVLAVLQRDWFFLGIFKRRGYEPALMTLRTRLAYSLHRILPAAEIGQWNDAIDALQPEKAELTARLRDAMAVLKLLQAANGKLVKLPLSAQAEVTRMAERARALRQSGNAGASPGAPSARPMGSGPVNMAYDPISNAWIDYSNDLPPGVQVMAFEALSHSHAAQPMSDHGNIVRAALPGQDIDFGDAGNGSADCAPVATDDSLGAFS